MSVEYCIKGMRDWQGLGADLVITDPPFGIDFDGDAGTYNRESGDVSEGYVEWDEEAYRSKVDDLLDVIDSNTHQSAQALIFSGWDNSSLVRAAIESHDSFTLEGKMYWSYNFAVSTEIRPAHNVYEIYWAVKGDDWFYRNRCTRPHCQSGEPNLTTLDINREWKVDQPSYPTELPREVVRVLVEHYSTEGDLVFDPLAGSGTVGVVAAELDRGAVMGDLNKEGKEIFKQRVADSSVYDADALDW